MYAVIRTGGKQYKVAKDQIVVVEKLAGEAGDSVAFDQVLLVGEDEKTTLGAPTVAGASVMAEVVEQTRGDKIIVFTPLFLVLLSALLIMAIRLLTFRFAPSFLVVPPG